MNNHFEPTPPPEDAPPAKACRQELARQQLLLREHRLPVLVVFEGWRGAGKGAAIRQVIRGLDPRFFSVAALPPLPYQGEQPFLGRFFQQVPPAGRFAFLCGGWMEQLLEEKLAGRLSPARYAAWLEGILAFERQLADSGCLLLKFFLQVSRQEQRRRLECLQGNPATAWQVGEADFLQNRAYDRWQEAFSAYRSATDTPHAPWLLVDSNQRSAHRQVLQLLTGALGRALAQGVTAATPPERQPALRPTPRLAEVPLSCTLGKGDYTPALRALQQQLGELQNALCQARRPVVLVYEGWDAAGKGGNIRRVTEALDPRGYQVLPIAAPEPWEKDRHYLWRFWARLPPAGQIAIFDRSWYGRVLVERIEGFCAPAEWHRAYREINEFEQALTEWGAVVVKFWLQIDAQTQLLRFQRRQGTPEKRWKMTGEDWRNREKWPQYEQAAEEMLEKTSTEYAPWHVIPANDKRFARVQTLRILVKAIRCALQGEE